MFSLLLFCSLSSENLPTHTVITYSLYLSSFYSTLLTCCVSVLGKLLNAAERYLNRQNATDELYHESFKNVSVIFASIPNYSKLYREHMFDVDGTKCLRVLNEIISDFDMVS